MEQPTPPSTPRHGPCPDPLTQVVTVADLADRLGIRPATIRQHLAAGTGMAWLPRPDGRINGGAVWRASTLEGIEERERPVGRPPRTQQQDTPAPSEQGDDGGWWEPDA